MPYVSELLEASSVILLVSPAIVTFGLSRTRKLRRSGALHPVLLATTEAARSSLSSWPR